MKYFIVAGEASGDLHASNLVKELNLVDKDASISGWGGELMKSAGVKILKHYKELAFMGFTEVLLNIRTIKKNFDLCKKQIQDFEPDALVFVDYPGFNLRMAKWAKSKGYKVFYYISPSVWAWKESRVELVRKYTDRMFVILPFEKPFYKKHEIEVEFEGHPLVDAVHAKKQLMPSREKFISEHNLGPKPLIAILPGSRKQEISVMLPIMSNLQAYFPEYSFVVAGTSVFSNAYYEQFMQEQKLPIVYDATHELLNYSHAGLIKSGTSTLEAALYDLPQIVCYMGGALSVWIAKKVAKVKYISLPNLILDEPVLTELIQSDLTVENLKVRLKEIVSETDTRSRMLTAYNRLKEVLGDTGASARVAAKIFSLTKSANAI